MRRYPGYSLMSTYMGKRSPNCLAVEEGRQNSRERRSRKKRQNKNKTL